MRSAMMLIVCFFALPCLAQTPAEQGPAMGTGIKIGEVTDTQAIIWCRTSREAARQGGDAVPRVIYRDLATGVLSGETKIRHTSVPIITLPEGHTVATLEGAVEGSPGEVRVRYKAAEQADWQERGWEAVNPLEDFTRQVVLSGLTPGTSYSLLVEARSPGGDAVSATLEASFRTAPPADAPTPVLFTVATCYDYDDRDLPEGFKHHGAMLALNPSFFVHTGDILYYDLLAKTRELALWHWARMYSLPTYVDFHRKVPSYFIKDDHDTWFDDCWPSKESTWMGPFSFAEGQRIFRYEVPMGALPYRTFRWGKDLQVWLVEGRDYRTPNTLTDGPDKTIWGAEQKAWFKQTVAESDATFRILISPTPLIGPDRGTKNDNHANAGFAFEGNELRQFIAGQKDMVVICGDRHWQYVSEDAETGLREYSSGPASDEHAGGWTNDQRLPEHRYLNVIGGFLAVTVERKEDKPVMTLRHHGVDGRLLNEEVRAAN